MQFGAVPGLRILATSTAFPCAVSSDALSLGNAGVLERLGCTDPDLLERAERWGVRRREWLQAPGATLGAADLVDLAEAAARTAVQAADIDPATLDALYLATSTPSRISSSAAARLAKRLGLGCLAIELRGGGAGALQGLALACTTPAARSLVVAAEVLSALVDPSDVPSALVYADGAAAVVIGCDAGHPGGLGAAELGTASVPGQPFTVPGRLPPTQAALDAGHYAFCKPERRYIEALGEVWDRTADRLRTMIPDDAVIAPYPVTRPLGARLLARLGMDWNQVAFPLEAHGCVGSAGVLVALDAALRAAPGRPVGLIAVGGGVTWGAMCWLP